MAHDPAGYDPWSIILKNVPSNLTELEVKEHFMSIPSDGVWACNQNKSFNRDTKRTEIISGQFFVNFVSQDLVTAAIQKWNGACFHGQILIVDFKRLRAGQPPTRPSEVDYHRWQQTLNERRKPVRSISPPTTASSPKSRPQAQSLNKSRPALLPSPPTTASSPEIAKSDLNTRADLMRDLLIGSEPEATHQRSYDTCPLFPERMGPFSNSKYSRKMLNRRVRDSALREVDLVF